MSTNKKYGLILPDKTKTLTFQASRNVFGNDSDSEDERSRKPVLLRPSDNINKQAKITQKKALIEDPTVYQYDEIYDSMTIKKEEKKTKSKEEKKPKYIENLMKSAQKRKIENERRIERQIQKEREEEGDEFADKEVFVTSAYKKKLEEMKLEDEKEKREEYLESIGDVTKQKDLGGFYRHLYEQKLGSDKPTTEESEVTRPNPEEKKVVLDSEKSDKSKRNYRKRKTSFDSKKHLSDGEIEDSDEEINRVNLEEIRLAKKAKTEQNIDADSDFSIDESSDEENVDKNVKDKEGGEAFKKPITQDTKTGSNSTINKDKVSNSKDEQKSIEIEAKPKIDVWKKRTVGVVFEEALKRYYERKAARGS